MYGILRDAGDGPTATVTKASGGYVLFIQPKAKPGIPAAAFDDLAVGCKVADMTAQQFVAAVRSAAGLGDYVPDPEPVIHVCADLVAVMARLRECLEPDAARAELAEPADPS